MDKTKFIVCINGFVRDEPEISFDFNSVTKYAYCPIIKYEGNTEKTSVENFYKRYGSNNCFVELYDNYDRSVYTNLVKSLNVPLFDKEKIPHDGVFSYFNHIRGVLKKCVDSEKNSSDEDIILLMRPDINIVDIKYNEICDLLNDEMCDVLVKSSRERQRTCSDLYFLFKKKNISSFIELFDAYKKYLLEYYGTTKIKTIQNTFPEAIFWHHLNDVKKLKIKVIPSDTIKFEFSHVCNDSCKHSIMKKLQSEK